MTNAVSRACHECIVHNLINHELDADCIEDKVDMFLRHLPSGKNPSWHDMTNEVLKRYSSILKGPLTLMFQRCWDCGCMAQSWKVGLKLVMKVEPLESFHQWRLISLMGGLHTIFKKVLANKLQNYLPKLIHTDQYGFICR